MENVERVENLAMPADDKPFVHASKFQHEVVRGVVDHALKIEMHAGDELLCQGKQRPTLWGLGWYGWNRRPVNRLGSWTGVPLSVTLWQIACLASHVPMSPSGPVDGSRLRPSLRSPAPSRPGSRVSFLASAPLMP